MNKNIPVLPIVGGTLVRAFLAVLAFLTRWLKAFARARRHRREAAALAGLDRRMLADIGLSRSDLNDAFSGPLWDDPTVLLSERADDRRRSRKGIPAPPPPDVEAAFRRQAPDSLPRYSI